MPSGISYKDFKECVKDAHNFESRNHKRYVIAYIEGDTIGLCDPSKQETYSANLKDIHRAVKEYGADHCTVDVMTKVVGRKAAPMAAALVYTALGNGSLSMVMCDIANMLSSMSDDELDNLLSHFSADDDDDDDDDDETADDLEDEADDEGEEAPTFTGLSAHLELPKNGRPNTYKQMLAFCDKDDLRDLAYYLDYPEGDFQFSKKRKATMEKEIFRLATEQIERWIDRLPLYDLQLLHNIVIDHRHEFPDAAVVPFVVRLGFVQYRVLKGKDSLIECQLCPEIEAALAPHIDAALSRKKSSNSVALDQALWGLINIYGVVPDFVLQKELPRVFKAWGVKVSDDEIDDYLNTAMIPLLCCEYNQDLDLDVYFSHLVSVEAWASGIDKNVKEGDAAPLEDFDRVKGLGHYPNVSPYSRASRAFYDMLCKYCPKNTADFLFAHFYAQSQRADYAPAAFMKEVIETLNLSHEEANVGLQAAQAFNNDLPRFYFCGRSSSDMGQMRKDNPNIHVSSTNCLVSPSEQSFDLDPTPALWPKVGRNDPCPCGSGKKFKNCHGRLN